MLSLLTLAVLGPDVLAPLPPYRRLDTATVFALSYEPQFVVLGSTFVSGNSNSFVAIDLRTMKPLWTVKAPKDERANNVSASGDSCFLTSTAGMNILASHLTCVDAKSGRIRWRLPGKAGNSVTSSWGGSVYASLAPSSVSAIDVATHSVRWTTKLSNAGANGIDTSVANASGLAVRCGDVTYGLAPSSGRIVWRETHTGEYGASLTAFGGQVMIPSNGGRAARSLASGQTLWKDSASNYDAFAGASHGVFVGLGAGQLRAVDIKTGRPKWSHKLGPQGTSGGNQYGAIVGGRIFARGISRAGIYDPSGKELWSAPTDEAYPEPCWTDGTHLVAFDGLRLIRYVSGATVNLPTSSSARQALATRLVADFDKLDDPDKKDLERLGDDAFSPLLAEFLSTCKAHDGMKESQNSYPLYSKFHDLGEILDKVATTKRTLDLEAALTACPNKSSAKPQLLTLLAKVGDPKEVTPFFLREINGVKTPGFEMYESNTYVARDYIIKSKDPRAVAFMLKSLRDPKADGTLREEAYFHLAGTGGEEGLRAVLEERRHRTLLRPLDVRVTSGYLGAGNSARRPSRSARERTPTARPGDLSRAAFSATREICGSRRKSTGSGRIPCSPGCPVHATCARQKTRRRRPMRVRRSPNS